MTCQILRVRLTWGRGEIAGAGAVTFNGHGFFAFCGKYRKVPKDSKGYEYLKYCLTRTFTYIYCLCMAKKPNKKNMTWTPTVEDRKLIDELKNKTGVNAESELMRMGLRKLAEAEGLR